VALRAQAALLALALTAYGVSSADEGPKTPASALASAPALAPAPAPASASALATCRPLRFEPPPPPKSDLLAPPLVDIEDPQTNLTHFFEHAAALLRGRSKTPVRIAVYGDSNGTMDRISGEMRRVLQTSYGDAGHGFIALARPWPWYLHEYVEADYMHDAWSAYTVTTHPTPALDPWYGPGLIVAQSKQTGAATWVQTAPSNAPIGTHVSHLEAWYLKWPPGGSFEVQVDGATKATADTHAEGTPSFGFVALDVPDGPHKMTMIAKSARPVRLLGAVLERDEPGFQVDGLGVGSLNCLCVLRESEELDRQVLAHRPYDLVVFHIGSNTWNPAVLDPVECMTSAIGRLRRAVPDQSVLIMTPPDWGLGGVTKTPAWLKGVESYLHRSAQQAPAAFYDFHRAMGGEGSMARFQQLSMGEEDGVHLTGRGGAFMGQRVVDALMRAFAAWAAEHPSAGCE
jgi:hypothetical protein